MWSLNFSVAEKRKATLSGYRRAFCVWTAHARGTPEMPGLGLGLVRAKSGHCEGIALRLDSRRLAENLRRLWEREMWTDVYIPLWWPVLTAQGPVDAIVFEVNPASGQYAGALSLPEAARHIASATGAFGSCREYLVKTLAALQENGLDSGNLIELLELVDRQTGHC